MTKDEFMAFAVESGMALLLEDHAGEFGNGTFENTPYPELETFANLVADAERAKVQDDINKLYDMYEQVSRHMDGFINLQREQVATIRARAAIRAMGNT